MKHASTYPTRASSMLASPALGVVLAKIEGHKAILRRLRGWLPSPLAEHCRDCAVGGQQRLILFTDGQAWAFQLRFYGPSLLEKLAQIPEYRFRTIEIRNLPAGGAVSRKRPRPAASPASADLIRDSANVSTFPELAAALARLADTLEAPT